VLREIVRGPEYPHITLSFRAAIFISFGLDLLSQKKGHLSPGSRTSDCCDDIWQIFSLKLVVFDRI